MAIRRARSRTWAVVIAVPAMTFAGMALGGVAAAAPSAHHSLSQGASGSLRQAPAGSNYVETNVDNPVVATPPVATPDTRSCTVTLADNFPSNSASGAAQNFSGTYQPPADCPGPWNKVVLTFTASVMGRQYDRSASIQMGNTTLWFGTTMEPDPAGITWTTTKDVTEYSSLLESPQSYSGGIGNYTNSTDNGVYYQTATLTFYEADRANPVPAEPNDVVGVGQADVQPGSTTASFTIPSLPQNIVRAKLEIYIKGNGCDEQWFSSVPTDIANEYPSAGFCPNGPYREVDTTIDGINSGVVQYFPYIYTGGIVPTLWRPVPAIGTFDMSPETLDVTPLAADLDKAGAHTITLTVPEANDVWNLEANLLLYTDSGAKVVTGGLSQDTIAPAADVQVYESTPSSTTVDATTTASRNSSLSGWVNTPQGRVTTVVTQTTRFHNSEQVTTNGLYESLTQGDTGLDTTRTFGAGQDQTSTHAWSYPLNVVEDIASLVDDNNFSLSGSVSMGRTLIDTTRSGRGPAAVTWSRDQLSSVGDETRVNGTDTEADGHAQESWVGTYDGGVYRHVVAGDHGLVTENQGGFVGHQGPPWARIN